MDEKFIRTGLLLGGEGLNRLARARVAVFGIGGVGGHAAEAMCVRLWPEAAWENWN